jgi:hypothetical protein
VPRDGIAVFAGGHLHDGGIDITLRDDTSGLTVCTGTATYHENPTTSPASTPVGSTTRRSPATRSR